MSAYPSLLTVKVSPTILFALLTFGPGSAAGQGKSLTPEPKEILAAAAQALQRIRSASYDATFETVSSGQKVIAAKGAVELERGRSSHHALPGRVHIKSDGFGGAQQVSFDGSVARRLVHDKKLLTEGLADKGGIGVAVNSSALLLLLWDMLWAEPLKHELAATVFWYVGLTSVDGVICHVVDVEYEVPGTDVRGARWWFALEDKLPRRLEKVLHMATGKVIHELRISNLRLGSGIPPSKFHLDLPEGYSYQPFVPGDRPKPVPIGEAAPDWALLDHSGKRHRLSDYRGEVVILNFWASWCGYSNLGIPAVQKVYEKYKGRAVRVFGISFHELEGADPVAYLKAKGANFPILLNGETIGDQYGVKGVPAYYVISPEGKVAYAKLEYNPNVPAQLEGVIEQLQRGLKGN